MNAEGGMVVVGTYWIPCLSEEVQWSPVDVDGSYRGSCGGRRREGSELMVVSAQEGCET